MAGGEWQRSPGAKVPPRDVIFLFMLLIYNAFADRTNHPERTDRATYYRPDLKAY
jgi:hypothetical protein